MGAGEKASPSRRRWGVERQRDLGEGEDRHHEEHHENALLDSPARGHIRCPHWVGERHQKSSQTRGARGDIAMTGRFWHEIEARPWPEVQAIQETRLRHQLAYLEGNSEFYRAKLKAAGVAFDQIRTTADLVRIPFTLKTELRDSLAECPPLGLHLAAPMRRVIH